MPVDILRAIARTESGRSRQGHFSPWPWTINLGGKGRWFEDPNEAIEFLGARLKEGARNFDVGCFQINYRWHGRHFTSLRDMFEPEANAAYAAEFLTVLHAEFGNWSDAISAYHSRTPKHGKRYVDVVLRHYANLTRRASFEPQTWAEKPRGLIGRSAESSNSNPLFVPTLAPRSRASLVPLTKSPAVGRLINELSGSAPG